MKKLKQILKTYFLSDIHLGFPTPEKSLIREKKLVAFLDEIKTDADEIFFVGDIFDFWWEYKKVVPRGFVRFLGKVAELADFGIKISFFTGNHDIWLKNYLPEELGVKIHTKPIEYSLYGKSFYIAHGDGLGDGDWQYKVLKKIFTSKLLQWFYSRIHPNSALGFGHRWSKNRGKKEKYIDFLGEDKEHLILYSKEILKQKHYDYFLFGHRHIPMIYPISQNTKYLNTGDWISNFTFIIADNSGVELMTYKTGKIEKFSGKISNEGRSFIV